MGSQSPHDRVLAVYRNERPDRTPVGIYSRYLPRGGAERAIRDLGMAIVEYHPVVSMPGPAWHLAPGYQSEITGAHFRIDVEWVNGQRVERRVFETPVGKVWEEVVQDKSGAGSERIQKHYITGKDDYRVVKYLVDHSVIRDNEEAIRGMIENLGPDGIVLGRVDRSPHQKCLIELVGPEKFLVDLYTDPEPPQELMAALDRQLDRSFDLIVHSGVEILWQPDNVTADMTPPRAYREYCLPFYRKHGIQAKAAAKPYAVHMDGRTRALGDLIQQSAFDVIESFSLPVIGGDLTLTEARCAFPSKVIIPNLPSNWCLRDDRELESLVRGLLAEAGADLPFMLGVSEDIPVSHWKRVLPLVCRILAEQG